MVSFSNLSEFGPNRDAPRRHRAHWLVMDPLQKWRLKWDILMMLMICFVMIVTPFELAFVSAVGWSRNYTPFPNKFISASRRVETPSRHRRDSCPSHNDVAGFLFDFERTEFMVNTCVGIDQ